MIRTNRGIIVHPRRNGHGMTMPIPKILNSDDKSNYIVNKKSNGTLIYKPLKRNKNPFDIKGINRRSYVQAMKSNHMSLDQGNAHGREAL